MKTIIGTDTIIMEFARSKIVIDVREDRVYVNGNWLQTSNILKEYDEEKMKQRNVKFPKKELMKIKDMATTLKITIGFDGRLFFNVYDNKSINEWRCPPIESYSWWHNRKAKQKQWYEGDLGRPERTWSTRYKSDLKKPNTLLKFVGD